MSGTEAKQDNVLFQVQLLVVKGKAEFKDKNKEGEKYDADKDYSIPNGRTVIVPNDGWVSIDETFQNCGGEIEPEDEIEPEEQTNDKESTAKKPDSKHRQTPSTPIERARTAFQIHKYQTLPRLKKSGAIVQLELVPYRREDALQAADKPNGIDTQDRALRRSRDNDTEDIRSIQRAINQSNDGS